jgi:2'-5' RNA ligase/GNAT superfamily N-acetyltransferase
VSPRRRLGVALMLDPPWSVEVQGLRRALGDTSLGSVAPHLTLVPPVNVRESELATALDVVRKAAAAQIGPFSLELGPAATFMPTNPVVYLSVGGTSLASLRRLREAMLAGPLLRPDRWPWAPHVTLADQASPGQAEAALVAVAHYWSEVPFDRVVIMEERHGQWLSLSDACLGPPVVMGRGGLELEITTGRIVGPDALGAMAGGDGPDLGRPSWAGPGTEGREAGAASHRAGTSSARHAPPPELEAATAAGTHPDEDLHPRHHGASIVLTGRRQGHVAGFAIAWQDGRVGAGVRVYVFVEAASRSQGVGRALLVALESSARRQGWEMEGVKGYGPAGFFTASSPWIRDVRSPAELSALGQPS